MENSLKYKGLKLNLNTKMKAGKEATGFIVYKRWNIK